MLPLVLSGCGFLYLEDIIMSSNQNDSILLHPQQRPAGTTSGSMMDDYHASGYGGLLDLTSHQLNLLLVRPILKPDFNMNTHARNDGLCLLDGVDISRPPIREAV